MTALTVNPTIEQKIARHSGRIETLKLAIAQTKNQARIASFNAELTRRTNELSQIRKQIDEAMGL